MSYPLDLKPPLGLPPPLVPPLRLIEHTLDTCQLKRSRAASAVRVDLRWLCTHLARWGMLGKDFMLPELALIAVFAKQPQVRYVL